MGFEHWYCTMSGQGVGECVCVWGGGGGGGGGGKSPYVSLSWIQIKPLQAKIFNTLSYSHVSSSIFYVSLIYMHRTFIFSLVMCIAHFIEMGNISNELYKYR